MKTIIAANYFNRKDKDNRWLTRPFDVEEPEEKDCQLHAGLIIGKAHAITSPEFEEGFGCSVVLETEDSTAELAKDFDITSFKAAGYVQLKFDGYAFCPVKTLLKVEHFDGIILLPNGEMWGKISE